MSGRKAITRCSNAVPALRASTRQFESSAFSELLREVYRNALLTNYGWTQRYMPLRIADESKPLLQNK